MEHGSFSYASDTLKSALESKDKNNPSSSSSSSRTDNNFLLPSADRKPFLVTSLNNNCTDNDPNSLSTDGRNMVLCTNISQNSNGFPINIVSPTGNSDEGAGALLHSTTVSSYMKSNVSSVNPSHLSVPPITLDSYPVFMECIIPFMDLRGVQNLCCTTSLLRETIQYSAGPRTIIINRPTLPLDSDPRSASFKVFQQFGPQLHNLTLYRTPMIDKLALPSILRMSKNLRKLSIHDCDIQHWSEETVSEAILSLTKLEELRIHCSDMYHYEALPFTKIIQGLPRLTHLRKLTLFSRLNTTAIDSLCAYIRDPNASRRLTKLKLSTSLIASPGGIEILNSINYHRNLQKLTIIRPEGMGEPIRKHHCTSLASIMVNCKSLHSLHLRRAGMWTDTLAALVPSQNCPNIQNIKLDSNSLAYLSATHFNEAMDNLLGKVPYLHTLHLGNNQLDSNQAVSLGNSITKHKISNLQNLTLGSNDIGDTGITAILKALPPTIKQLYLHGCDIHDEGLIALRSAFDRMPELWGLGLNGNPISDKGVALLAEALARRSALRDVGITLSDMTDNGVHCIANALGTCPKLRFVYLYTQGFKAAVKVTEEGKQYLRRTLPPHATAAFDHRLSRYLKTP